MWLHQKVIQAAVFDLRYVHHFHIVNYSFGFMLHVNREKIVLHAIEIVYQMRKNNTRIDLLKFFIFSKFMTVTGNMLRLSRQLKIIILIFNLQDANNRRWRLQSKWNGNNAERNIMKTEIKYKTNDFRIAQLVKCVLKSLPMLGLDTQNPFCPLLSFHFLGNRQF